MSNVWQYFKVDSTDDKRAVCLICNSSCSFSCGGKSHNTSNLRKHLSRHNLKESECETQPPKKANLELQNNDCNVDDPAPSISTVVTDPVFKPRAQNQPTLKTFIDLKQKFKPGDRRQIEITKKIGKMMCTDNQPFSIVEDRGFKELIDHMEPRYTMPSRKYFSATLIPNMYEETKARFKTCIGKSQYVAVTTDMWSSTANDDYLSLTAHVMNDTFEMEHFALEVVPFPEVSHTAVNISDFLEATVTDWGLNGKVVCVVHDNGRNVTAAMKLTGLQHVPCTAHTLQLVIHDCIFNSKVVSNTVAICRRLVGSFKHSTKATKLLKSAQNHVSLPNHRLIQDEPTRWNSTYLMLARLYEQRRAIIFASSDLSVSSVELTSSQWELIGNVIKILEIFYEATQVLSSESVSLSEVILIVNSAVLELQTPAPVGSGLQGMKNDLVASFKKRFEEIESNQLYTTATLLDPRFKSKFFSTEEIIIKARTHLVNETHPQEPASQHTEEAYTSSPTTTHGMWTFYHKVMGSSTSTEITRTSAEQEVSSYLSEPLLPPDGNVLHFWKNCHSFPRLKKLVPKYLCIPPATVSSERLFSTAGLICDKKRNRLDPERVRMMVFLNKNVK